MINKLRKRFILIAMCSISLVLLLIIGSINISNYVNVGRIVSDRIELIMQNNGELPPPDMFHHDMRFRGAEAAFDTRFFTVSLKSDGTINSINTGRIFAIDSDSAANYATNLFNKNKSSGYVNTYRYKRFDETDSNDNNSILYVFVDAERELNTFRSFAIASISISIVGLLLVFILIYFFSFWVTKPMAESYNKQKRFITDASHELKTPLTIIDANTEVIEMTTGENEWTKSTRNQVKRLTSMTEKLVMLARMDEENAKPTMESFSLSDAVYDTAYPFEAVAKATNKSLNININPNINYIGNEKNIRQLVSLLMDNAIKYSSADGNISISLLQSGKNIFLTVANSVEQIQPGKHDELFERFYRADASHNSKTGGFGIGLSVAYAIVNAHKGKISAYSNDDKSIQFTVTM